MRCLLRAEPPGSFELLTDPQVQRALAAFADTGTEEHRAERGVDAEEQAAGDDQVIERGVAASQPHVARLDAGTCVYRQVGRQQ